MRINVHWDGSPRTAKITDEVGNNIGNILSMDIHLTTKRELATADVEFCLIDENLIREIEVNPESLKQAKHQIKFLKELLDNVERDIKLIES